MDYFVLFGDSDKEYLSLKLQATDQAAKQHAIADIELRGVEAVGLEIMNNHFVLEAPTPDIYSLKEVAVEMIKSGDSEAGMVIFSISYVGDGEVFRYRHYDDPGIMRNIPGCLITEGNGKKYLQFKIKTEYRSLLLTEKERGVALSLARISSWDIEENISDIKRRFAQYYKATRRTITGILADRLTRHK